MTVNTKTWILNKDEKPGEEHQIYTEIPHKKSLNQFIFDLTFRN